LVGLKNLHCYNHNVGKYVYFTYVYFTTKVDMIQNIEYTLKYSYLNVNGLKTKLLFPAPFSKPW